MSRAMRCLVNHGHEAFKPAGRWFLIVQGPFIGSVGRCRQVSASGRVLEIETFRPVALLLASREDCRLLLLNDVPDKVMKRCTCFDKKAPR